MDVGYGMLGLSVWRRQAGFVLMTPNPKPQEKSCIRCWLTLIAWMLDAFSKTRKETLTLCQKEGEYAL